jgi:PAS domain S-box-containing protein
VPRSKPVQGAPEFSRMERVGPVHLAVFEAFVDTTGDAMFSVDTSNRVTTWNRAAGRAFGYDVAAIVGAPWTALFPASCRLGLELLFDAVAAGDRVERYETEIERHDGRHVPVALALCPVFHGQVRVATVAVIQDIAEQRLTQSMLAEAELRLQEGEALAHVGRWLWDVATGVVQWSDEFHRIHGVDPLDFDGTVAAHLDFVHPDDRERVHEALEFSVAAGRAFDEEYRLVRPDGELRWISSRAEPTIDGDGHVVGLRGMGQDITDRRLDSSP